MSGFMKTVLKIWSEYGIIIIIFFIIIIIIIIIFSYLSLISLRQ